MFNWEMAPGQTGGLCLKLVCECITVLLEEMEGRGRSGLLRLLLPPTSHR